MTGRPLLAIDTSGTRALVALGSPDGALIDERRWLAGYRHGEELLTRTDELLRTNRVALAELGGIVVGTGPGAFTGMRVGIATAKALARGLGIPIAGVATSQALLVAADAGVESRPSSCCRPDLQIESSSSPARQRWSKAEKNRSCRRMPSSWPWICRTAPRPGRWRWASRQRSGFRPR